MDKKFNKKYIINIILILLLGIVVVYLTMKDDLKASLSVLINASPVWIVFSIFLMSIYYILDGINLYIVGKSYKRDYSFKQGFKNAISGTFLWYNPFF